MKRAIILMVVLVVSLSLFHCGGPKKLTQDEYAQMPPQERVAHLEKYIEKNPNDIEQKKYLYQEYLKMDMPDRAIPLMKDILRIDPNQPEVQFEYGELMMARGENQLGYQAFLETLRSTGGSMYVNRIAKHLGGRYLLEQLTNSPNDEAFPAFSPDNSKLVFQIKQNGNWDILEYDISSGESKVLMGTEADEELPSYSPNGKEIVFTSNLDDRRPIDNKFKVREIYLKELESGFVKNLTETVADDWLPRFNHQGNKIVFVTERSDLRSVPYTEKQSDIYLMENDGDFHARLTQTESNDGGASFAPDDAKIYFHSNRNGSYDIFVMKANGSLPMTVLGSPVANEVNPFVAPDSAHLVYFSDEGGNYDIYRAGIDGSGIERLTLHPAKDTNPVVSPDGRMIAFQSDRNGNYDIFLLNLDVENEPTADALISQLNQLLGS